MRCKHGVLLCLFLGVHIAHARPKKREDVKQKLEILAIRIVKAQCQACKVKVQCKWLPPALAKARANTIADIRFVDPGLPVGYVKANVILKSKSALERSSVQFYISIQLKQPVARTTIKRGESINKNDLIWKWKKVSHRGRKPIMSHNLLENKTADHRISKGQIFYRSDLTGPSVIQPGDHVTMLYNKGGILIHFDCVAREAKGVGQKIRLLSKETGRLYLAKIKSKGQIIWKKTL